MVKTTLRTLSLLFILSLIIGACKEEKAPPKMILDIPVVEAESKQVPILNDFVGQTYGYFDIAIRARVEGFLTGRHFEEGTFVKDLFSRLGMEFTRGQLMMIIYGLLLFSGLISCYRLWG